MVGWSVWDEMRRVHDEMDNMFRGLLSREPFGSTGLLEGPSNSDIISADFRQPLLDMWEDEKEVKVKMELPGVDKKDIMVRSRDGGVEVKVETKDEYKEEDKDKGFYRLERRCSGFYRNFALPENADSENMDAKYKNGILELTIPKKEIEEKTKKIEVK